MEKKMAFMPPSRMRGMSMCPVELRLPRSKSLEKKRWVVSSWVSATMEEKWSRRACSETESAGGETSRATAPKRQTNRETSERIIRPPERCMRVGRVADLERRIDFAGTADRFG